MNWADSPRRMPAGLISTSLKVREGKGRLNFTVTGCALTIWDWKTKLPFKRYEIFHVVQQIIWVRKSTFETTFKLSLTQRNDFQDMQVYVDENKEVCTRYLRTKSAVRILSWLIWTLNRDSNVSIKSRNNGESGTCLATDNNSLSS